MQFMLVVHKITRVKNLRRKFEVRFNGAGYRPVVEYSNQTQTIRSLWDFVQDTEFH